MAKRIILGSGELFRVAVPSDTIADPETYCVEANRFSHIKNGATLEYTQEKTTVEDDLGLVHKTRLNTESAKLKCGLMTLEPESLKYLSATAGDPTNISASGSGSNATVAKKQVKIGGIKNESETPHLWIFHHKDDVDGDIWVVLKGNHNTGFNIQFKKDDANVSDLEIDAQPLDDDGHKVYYYEEVKGTTPTTTP